MKSLDSGAVTRSQADDALRFMVGLGADRALVLLRSPDLLEVAGAHGLDETQPLIGLPVGLSIIEEVVDKAVPVLAADAASGQDQASSWSLEVANVRSILCVPFWGRDGKVKGALYADSNVRAGVFDKDALSRLLSYARGLEARFQGKEPPSVESARPARPFAPRPSKPRPVVPARPSAAPTGEQALVHSEKRPGRGSYKLFFRSLSMLLETGTVLPRALELAGQGQDEAMQAMSQRMALLVNQGNRLSAAAAEQPFTDFQLQMIRMGETTGGLPGVLSMVAEYEEKLEASRLRLRSILTYPAIVLLLCVVMLILGPPFLLRGQLEMIQSFGGTPPMVTLLMIWFSDLVQTPWFLLLAGLLVAAGLVSARTLWRKPSIRLAVHSRLLALPALGKVLRMVAVSRFALALSLMTRTGLPILQALPLAGAASASPVLESHIGQAAEDLKEGSGVAGALEGTGFFPPGVITMVALGEESGTLSDSLSWVAKTYELELDVAVETFVSLIEPTILLIMGTVVGGMLLATLLPLLEAVQSL